MCYFTKTKIILFNVLIFNYIPRIFIFKRCYLFFGKKKSISILLDKHVSKKKKKKKRKTFIEQLLSKFINKALPFFFFSKILYKRNYLLKNKILETYHSKWSSSSISIKKSKYGNKYPKYKFVRGKIIS